MEKVRTVFAWIFGLLLLATGINHFLRPGFYAAFIPDWLPLLAVNYLFGLIEALLGIGLLLPFSRRAAAIGSMLLMVFFLPFHVVDAFRKQPAIGSVLFAWIRLAFQFVLIYWAWFLVPPAKARWISANKSPLPPP